MTHPAAALAVAILATGALAPLTDRTSPAPVVSTAAAASASVPRQADPEPFAVVEAYFSAINDGDYVAAWALGGKNIARGTYDDFVDSFATTAHDDVTVISVTGETVEVDLDATQTDGSHRLFTGTYTVRDGAIVSADIHPE
ncbi:hypothetical protein [Streptomyces spongiae]|uniref:Nuclear transport factor 2 family protein n=1 Tax=Streptomyces spongiae TaxID=565072 RepID=A0A5N8XI06_9ACTN|nr:hypothetical protein [Streptomyces spongiae]MPY59102.1 hypothetical protein [Streptomyces spongiae]